MDRVGSVLLHSTNLFVCPCSAPVTRPLGLAASLGCGSFSWASALLGSLFAPAAGLRTAQPVLCFFVLAPLSLHLEASLSDKDPVGCVACAGLRLVQPWGPVTQAQSQCLKGRAIASSAWAVGCGPQLAHSHQEGQEVNGCLAQWAEMSGSRRLECGLKATTCRAPSPSSILVYFYVYEWFCLFVFVGVFVVFFPACIFGYHVHTSSLWRPEEGFKCPVKFANSQVGAGI